MRTFKLSSHTLLFIGQFVWVNWEHTLWNIFLTKKVCIKHDFEYYSTKAIKTMDQVLDDHFFITFKTRLSSLKKQFITWKKLSKKSTPFRKDYRWCYFTKKLLGYFGFEIATLVGLKLQLIGKTIVSWRQIRKLTGSPILIWIIK